MGFQIDLVKFITILVYKNKEGAIMAKNYNFFSKSNCGNNICLFHKTTVKKGSPNPELVKVVMNALPTLAKTVIDVIKK